jgi:hypothetical protein
LDRAEHALGPARPVPHDIAAGVDDTHFAVRPNDAVFHVIAHSGGAPFRRCPGRDRPIFEVNQCLHLGKPHWMFPRQQAKDAVSFV